MKTPFWLRWTTLAVAGAAVPATGVAAPTPAQYPPPRSLSLSEAVNDALAQNVQTLLARAAQAQAQGQRIQARSAFLPHLSASASEARRRTNLAAQGFNFGSDVGGGAQTAALAGAFPSMVTYNNFDARATLRQMLFDYSAWQKYRGAQVGTQIAGDRLAVARQQVATQAELDYVSALAAGRAVRAARADIKQARALLKLARDQRRVGVATGVDVTRARARLARDQADLAQRQTRLTRADIQLARTTGLPLDSNLRLTDPLLFRPMALGPIGAALGRALATRPEIAMARDEIARSSHQLAAARGKRWPTVSLKADYGASGNTPERNDRPTYAVGAQIQLPLFSGGAIGGAIDSARSQLAQRRIHLHDTRRQVEADVRTARRTLETLNQRVRAARSNLTLARQEMQRARDRFAHGVGDNIEVVDAQADLADARNGLINALAEYTRARINLAAAMGRAPQFRLQRPMTP